MSWIFSIFRTIGKKDNWKKENFYSDIVPCYWNITTSNFFSCSYYCPLRAYIHISLTMTRKCPYVYSSPIKKLFLFLLREQCKCKESRKPCGEKEGKKFKLKRKLIFFYGFTNVNKKLYSNKWKCILNEYPHEKVHMIKRKKSFERLTVHECVYIMLRKLICMLL